MTANTKTNPARYATIDIMRYDAVRHLTYQTVWVSKDVWASVNEIDYIELDCSQLSAQYVEQYSEAACDAMRAIVAANPQQ